MQSKTCQGSRYPCGATTTIQEIVDKAIEIDPNAELSFARLEGSKVVEHIIGRADLLDGYTTRNGTQAHSISFTQLRDKEFKNVE